MPLPANKRPLLPGAALLAALLLGLLSPVKGAELRPPLIYGISQKPFPILSGIDYQLARSEAWLAALKLAEAHLPQGLIGRLHNSGYATPLGRLAFCALLCPLDVVTPEKAPGNKIRVFLVWPKDPLAAGLEILNLPGILDLEMCLIRELQQASEELRSLWPDSLSSWRRDLAQLESLAEILRELWQGLLFNSDELEGREGKWTTAFRKTAASPALTIASAEQSLPETAAPLDEALALLSRRETGDREDFPLWNRLSARALILRSRIHAKRDAMALAEADLKAALARLQKSADNAALASHAWGELGELYRQRGEYKKMCAAFSAACSKGQCQQLSFARRNGYCLAGGEAE